MADVTTTKISATSRCAVKLRDNYYTFEASEERTINNPENVNVEEEWSKLFEAVNEVIDLQIEDLMDAFKNQKNK